MTTLPTLHDLYPDLTAEELVEAEENLERYLTLVLRIFERLETAPQPNPLAPGTSTLSSTLPESPASG